MYFEPYGPFLPRDYIDSEERYWRDNFWQDVNKKWPGLSAANGVYVFSRRFGSKFTPWYVGKTCSAKGFCGEVFQDHKLEHYFQAGGKRGIPCLHLIAKVEANRGNFSKYSDKGWFQIEKLETHLIAMALSANPALRNNSKTKFNRELDIAGVIGPKYSGRPSNDARTLKNVLGLVRD